MQRPRSEPKYHPKDRDSFPRAACASLTGMSTSQHLHRSIAPASTAIAVPTDDPDETFADPPARSGKLVPLRTLAEARLASATAPELVKVYVTQVSARAASTVIKYVITFSPRLLEQQIVDLLV